MGSCLTHAGSFQAKNKSWFGILNVFKLLLYDWTILREAARAVMIESGGKAQTEPKKLSLTRFIDSDQVV